MKERIRQLLNEATVGLEPDLSLQRTVTLNEMEKFAELIIQDILDIIANPMNYNRCVYTTFDASQARAVAEELSKKIKEHFKDTE